MMGVSQNHTFRVTSESRVKQGFLHDLSISEQDNCNLVNIIQNN